MLEELLLELDNVEELSNGLVELTGEVKDGEDADVLDEFDRVVFESIVEKVVVGDMEEDGTADPYKLTFVLKGMDDRSIPYARDRYMNLCEKAV